MATCNDTYYYTIAIKSTEPDRPHTGWLWLNPSTGQVQMYLESAWLPLCAGNPITVYREGFKWLRQYAQASEPTGEPGLIWINTGINQAYIYIHDWVPFVGA